MRELEIDEIALNDTDHLLVRPGHVRSYSMIYRAANGLRWNEALAAIVAYEPDGWVHGELLAHVLATIESECDERLIVGAATKWVGISDDLRRELLSCLPSISISQVSR